MFSSVSFDCTARKESSFEGAKVNGIVNEFSSHL